LFPVCRFSTLSVVCRVPLFTDSIRLADQRV
jgi:hypothetical protein